MGRNKPDAAEPGWARQAAQAAFASKRARGAGEGGGVMVRQTVLGTRPVVSRSRTSEPGEVAGEAAGEATRKASEMITL